MADTEPNSIGKAKTMYKACMNISKFSKNRFYFFQIDPKARNI